MNKIWCIWIGLCFANATQVGAQRPLEMYAENISECMGRYEHDFVKQVCLAVDEILIEKYGPNNNRFYAFMSDLMSEKIEDSIFKLSAEHKLRKFIKKGKSRKFWVLETSSADVSNWVIAKDKNFIYCAKELIEHKGLSIYYLQYERFKLSSGKVRAKGMNSFFAVEDYDLQAVRWFILMEVMMNEILGLN